MEKEVLMLRLLLVVGLLTLCYAQDLMVYNDTLNPVFKDVSTADAQHKSLVNRKPVFSGATSISFIPDGANTLSFICSNCFNSSYTLQFYVNGGTSGNQKIVITILEKSLQILKIPISSCLEKSFIPSNSWALASCKFSNLSNTALSGISFQSASGPQPQLFLDQITLIAPSVKPIKPTPSISHPLKSSRSRSRSISASPIIKHSPSHSKAPSHSSLPSRSQHKASLSSSLKPSNTPNPSTSISAAPSIHPIICEAKLHWSSSSNGILLNKNPFYIKGVSWFGFETHYVPDGLGSNSISLYRAFTLLSKNNFNSLRIPISLEMVLSNPIDPFSLGTNSNPSGIPAATSKPGSKALDILDQIILYAQGFNILIVLDMHVLQTNGTANPLWYDTKYTEAQMTQGWVTLAQRYKTYWNVFAADLKSNIHGIATWNSGDLSTDWMSASQRISNAILNTGVNWLIFIQGVENVADQQNNVHFWGGNFEGVQKSSGQIILERPEYQDRIVYSPHVFGPSVEAEIQIKSKDKGGSIGSGKNKDYNTRWNIDFGAVPNITGRAVVIGEFGGKNASQDEIWLTTIGEYLIQNNFNSIYYWSLTSDFSGRRGLLDKNWKNEDQELLEWMKKVVASPSVVDCQEKSTKSEGSIVVNTRTRLEEKTSTEIPLVVASERGPGQCLIFN
eukprot:TRINITY_DN14748_c0_g1_i2.p1 TRINITY_DN14748_c0_g1~~TRINITY_DN14748_c0_g1_i2.p1  ORF type:complete len:675 (-),score=127.95 TRINITY_DN14748_c0_g1_i2:44-2068(-)